MAYPVVHLLLKCSILESNNNISMKFVRFEKHEPFFYVINLQLMQSLTLVLAVGNEVSRSRCKNKLKSRISMPCKVL